MHDPDLTLPPGAYALELAAHGPAWIGHHLGISRAMQRDWRRRGLISPMTGAGGRHHIGDLINHLLLRAIGDRIGDLVIASPIARAWTPPVLARVLSDQRAWSGDSVAWPGRVAALFKRLALEVPPDTSIVGVIGATAFLTGRDFAELRDELRARGETGPFVAVDFDDAAAAILAALAGVAVASLRSLPATQTNSSTSRPNIRT